MELNSASGMAFKLKIMGYAYPSIRGGGSDSNWLMIRIDVAHPKGNWISTDPSLLTSEVAYLAKWLYDIYNGEPVNPVEAFIEPNIEFRLVSTEDSESKALRICFELESRPPWATAYGADKDEVWVQFPLAEINLELASKQLMEQLQRFPQRGKG